MTTPANVPTTHAKPIGLAHTQPTGRVRRNRARLMTRITLWWSQLPLDAKPNALTPAMLAHLFNATLQRLAPALRALGWTRLLRRIHGKPTTIWIPPGSPVTRRPRGRPALHTYF